MSDTMASPARPAGGPAVRAQRMDLFTTPLLRVPVPDAERLNRELMAAIRARRESHPQNEARSSHGGWHSDSDMLVWGGEAAATLIRIAVNAASQHMIDVYPPGQRRFRWAFDMWANIHGPGDSIQFHCHPGAFWSAVYYPDVGSAAEPGMGGEIVFEDPRYPMTESNVPYLMFKTADGLIQRSQAQFTPEAGTMIMFPSWLRHAVRPHSGTRERVSIAMNFVLTDTARERTANGR